MATVDPKIAKTVAHMPEIHGAVIAERDKLLALAEGFFAPHNHPGRHELGKVDEKVDALVVFEGPSFASVMSVEFGHWAGEGDHRVHVEGLHILGRAIAAASA